jgi:hypothetical protein
MKLTLSIPKIKKICKLPEEHTGGFIFEIPGVLAALGDLVGGFATATKTVLDVKKNNAELEEQKRHNTAIESRHGSGLKKKKKALINLDIKQYAKMLQIKNFRGVFMSDELPKKPNKNECGVLNLDTSQNIGTHWICYWERGNAKYVLDSFGGVPHKSIVE